MSRSQFAARYSSDEESGDGRRSRQWQRQYGGAEGFGDVSDYDPDSADLESSDDAPASDSDSDSADQALDRLAGSAKHPRLIQELTNSRRELGRIFDVVDADDDDRVAAKGNIYELADRIRKLERLREEIARSPQVRNHHRLPPKRRSHASSPRPAYEVDDWDLTPSGAPEAHLAKEWSQPATDMGDGITTQLITAQSIQHRVFKSGAERTVVVCSRPSAEAGQTKLSTENQFTWL